MYQSIYGYIPQYNHLQIEELLRNGKIITRDVEK